MIGTKQYTGIGHDKRTIEIDCQHDTMQEINSFTINAPIGKITVVVNQCTWDCQKIFVDRIFKGELMDRTEVFKIDNNKRSNTGIA